MKIAIDESGDSGMRMRQGSSRWFVLCAVIVPEGDERLCGPICQAVASFRSNYMDGQELHYSRNSHAQHDAFFRYMQDKDFVYAAVAIDKRRLLYTKPWIFRNKMTFLRYSFDLLLGQIQPGLDSPTLLVDTNGSWAFNQALSRYVVSRFGSRHQGDLRSIRRFVAVDSMQEPLVQLADYVAGAVRHHVDNRYQSTIYGEYLRDKGSIFYTDSLPQSIADITARH